MSSVHTAIVSFFSQPWGVVGALCIMLAITAFNSQKLRDQPLRLNLAVSNTTLVLNGFNLVGGACLLVNAVTRDEIVWIVLEVYFVLISAKGVWQSHAALDARREPGAEAQRV